jgi:hypothetical protein
MAAVTIDTKRFIAHSAGKYAKAKQALGPSMIERKQAPLVS